ncbi:hypothetical protein [Gemmobacter sp. 24YEA27]|nr:hypothetical protein [Gemmobacter sp. 24YEA27]
MTAVKKFSNQFANGVFKVRQHQEISFESDFVALPLDRDPI